VTGRHQGPKRRHYNGRAMCRQSYFCLLDVMVTNLIFFIVECGIMRFLCAVRVFDVRASSSPPGLSLCQISFLIRSPLLSYPMEKNHILNHSLTQSLTQLI